MKAQSSITVINRAILGFIFLLFGHSAWSQCEFAACENLYIGTIGVPVDDNDLIILRDALRADIGATLDELSPCTFVERSYEIDNRIKDERREFTPQTYEKIREYRDRFKRSIDWMLVGEIRELSRFDYRIEIKIVEISTRTTQYRFTHQFKYDEDFKYEVFLESFQLALLKETGQLLKVIGQTNYDKMDPKQIRVFPTPWKGKVAFDPYRSEFSFHISKCELERQNLRIDIRSASFAGRLDTLINLKRSSASEVDVGTIKISTTRGLNFKLAWPKNPLSNDDFDIESLTFRSPDRFMSKPVQLDYIKESSGFTFEFPAGVPANTTATMVFNSRNYTGFTSTLELGIDQNNVEITPGNRRNFLLRKFIPGLHQLGVNRPLEAGLFAVLQGVTIHLYLNEIDQARGRELLASTNNNFVTRNKLIQQAKRDRQWADFYLAAAIVNYLANWYHALFIAPFFPEKMAKKYQISPRYQAGSIGLNLSLKIASQ